MAAGCNGNHTRFQFIATVRSLVATMVTVLAIAVVVMVIVVVNRPVEMAFRSSGYVQAAQDWWQIVANITPLDAAAPSSYRYGPLSSRYGPAEMLDMLFVLHADNPSGRGQIKGSIDILRLVDIPNMVEICKFEPAKVDPKASSSFDLPPHSSHVYIRWVNMTDQAKLKSLYDNHGQDRSGFSVMLVVETAYKSPRRYSEKNVSYYCSPMTFLQQSASQLRYGVDITCKTAQDMGYTPQIQSET